MSIAQAKIPCSGLCRCVGCRNLPDKPENKSLMHLADAAGTLLLLCVCTRNTAGLLTDLRTQQQAAATSHLLETLDLTPEPLSQPGQRLLFTKWPFNEDTYLSHSHRLPFSFINKEVSKATCLCLLEEASHVLMVSTLVCSLFLN